MTHLTTFLQGYAAFARIPQPARAAVPWGDFLEGVRRLVPFRIEEPLPERPGHFDPALVQQVLINLVKNAREAGSAEEDVVGVGAAGRRWRRRPARRRPGPRHGRGGGAAVAGPVLHLEARGQRGWACRSSNEIIEAHGGRLQLENRADGWARRHLPAAWPRPHPERRLGRSKPG